MKRISLKRANSANFDVIWLRIDDDQDEDEHDQSDGDENDTIGDETEGREIGKAYDDDDPATTSEWCG